MPTQATIAITPGSGQLLDAVSLVIGPNTVVRETMVLADSSNPTSLAGVTAAGALQVDGSAVVQPVSGTITANQGGSPWGVDVQRWGATNLGSPALFGTSPGAVNAAGANASIFAGTTALSATGSSLNANITNTVSVTFPSTQSINLAQVGAAAVTLGAKTSANSIPVVLASDEATLPVSIAAAIDVSDRAARLVGVVYGSQGQQLKQTATNFNLQTELATGGTLYDARQIRALTSADVVTAAQATAANLNATIVFASPQHTIVDSGSISITGTPTVDVTDRTARLLGNARMQDGSGTALTSTGSALDVNLKTSSITLPVSIAAAIDVSDRAARLVGVVYGSQAQQLKQTATNFNLQTELATGGTLYDARQIRTLTSADVVSAVQSALWNVNQAIGVAGFEKITDGTNTAAVKAASTPAAATDPAVVVAVSPNNTVATSNAAIGTTGAAAPASADQIGFVDAQNTLRATTPTNPLPVQTDPQMLQVVQILGRILACLESMKMMQGTAIGAFENTDDYLGQAN